MVMLLNVVDYEQKIHPGENSVLGFLSYLTPSDPVS